MPPGRSGPSALAAVLAVLSAQGAGCDDYEQQAMRAGHEAHARIASECEKLAGEAFATCMREVCIDGCTSLGEAARFRETCMTACTEKGVCTTDEDCRPPEACVTIAPRVRRCGVSATEAR